MNLAAVDLSVGTFSLIRVLTISEDCGAQTLEFSCPGTVIMICSSSEGCGAQCLSYESSGTGLLLLPFWVARNVVWVLGLLFTVSLSFSF